MKNIPLFSRPKHKPAQFTGMHVLVDDADFDRVTSATHYWTISFDRFGHPRYPVGAVGGHGKQISIHRFIMDAQPGQLIDHTDRNVFNCQRSNLRFCSRAQNVMNISTDARRKLSPYRGVARYGGRWMSQISANKKRYVCGVFPTPEEAARAYDAMALKYHGEFAVLNFGSAS